jgi:hypothetical protein
MNDFPISEGTVSLDSRGRLVITTENRIRVCIGPNSLLAHYTGPHTAEIRELFGTDTIPLPYGREYSLERAADLIRRNNPDVQVFVQR